MLSTGGFETAGMFCGISILHYDIKGELLFLHFNLIKGNYNDRSKFSLENHPLSLIKRFKPLTLTGEVYTWDHAKGA
ncbi:hypothetical protein HK096_010664, partial [Nowakowskiella sp. JEL0078]